MENAKKKLRGWISKRIKHALFRLNWIGINKEYIMGGMISCFSDGQKQIWTWRRWTTSRKVGNWFLFRDLRCPRSWEDMRWTRSCSPWYLLVKSRANEMHEEKLIENGREGELTRWSCRVVRAKIQIPQKYLWKKNLKLESKTKKKKKNHSQISTWT